MKKLMTIAAAVVLLAVATVAIGGAATAQESDGGGPLGSLLDRVAEKLGVSTEDVETAFDEARLKVIDEALADGRLTEAQAERLRERAKEGGFPFRGRPHRAGGHILDAAADVLEMPKEDVVHAVKDGSSLAELAAAQDISVDGFEAQLLTEVRAHIDAKVADGTISQEQADRLSEGLEERIDNIVNAQPGEGGLGGPRHRHGGFGGPWHAPLDEAEETPEVSA